MMAHWTCEHPRMGARSFRVPWAGRGWKPHPRWVGSPPWEMRHLAASGTGRGLGGRTPRPSGDTWEEDGMWTGEGAHPPSACPLKQVIWTER